MSDKIELFYAPTSSYVRKVIRDPVASKCFLQSRCVGQYYS
jgi:hypothetical protein